jgi:hypothetical protein
MDGLEVTAGAADVAAVQQGVDVEVVEVGAVAAQPAQVADRDVELGGEAFVGRPRSAGIVRWSGPLRARRAPVRRRR